MVYIDVLANAVGMVAPWLLHLNGFCSQVGVSNMSVLYWTSIFSPYSYVFLKFFSFLKELIIKLFKYITLQG